MAAIAYFIDQIERLEAYTADDDLAFPAIAKQEFSGILIVGRNGDAIKVKLEESGQKTGRGFDFTFKYADIDTAKITSNGGGTGAGYPAIASVENMVSWLRYAIWGKGSASGGGAITSFNILGDDWNTLDLVDGTAVSFPIQLMQAGYREVAFTAAEQVVVSLPAGFPPPSAQIFRDIGGGEIENFGYASYRILSNTLTITWTGVETGKLVLK